MPEPDNPCRAMSRRLDYPNSSSGQLTKQKEIIIIDVQKTRKTNVALCPRGSQMAIMEAFCGGVVFTTLSVSQNI
jgi:hypothetical protein